MLIFEQLYILSGGVVLTNFFENKKSDWILIIIFRIFLVIGVIYQTKYDEAQEITSYFIAALGIYILVFLLIKNLRISSIVEFILIFGLYYFFEINQILYLICVAFISYIISLDKKWYDFIVYPLLFLGGYYFLYSNFVMKFFLYLLLLSMFMVLILYTDDKWKKNRMKNAMINLDEKSKQNQKLGQELMYQKKNLDITSKMFAQFQVINQKLDLEYLKNELLKGPVDLLNANFSVLYTRDKSLDFYKIDSTYGENKNEYDIPERLTLDDFDNVSFNDNYIRVNILLDGKEWGILDIYDKNEEVLGERKIEGAFSIIDFERIQIFVQQVAFSMNHALLLDKYKQLANNDFLTQLPNRRNFFEKFNYLVERAHRGEELAFVLLDIDDFKRINDTYGHDIGDKALITIAKTLEQSVRKIDVIGRLGGEEFGILIPNANTYVKEIIKRIKTNIKEIEFEPKMTLSIGVAYFGTDARNVNELYKKADEALYIVKNNGKNNWLEYQNIQVFLQTNKIKDNDNIIEENKEIEENFFEETSKEVNEVTNDNKKKEQKNKTKQKRNSKIEKNAEMKKDIVDEFDDVELDLSDLDFD